jgi:hypothetical protein
MSALSPKCFIPKFENNWTGGYTCSYKEVRNIRLLTDDRRQPTAILVDSIFITPK